VCVLISFAVVGGRTVRIRTVRTTRKEGTIFEAACWHKIEVVWSVFLLQLGHTDQAVQQTVGTFFKALFSGWVIQLYGFGTFFKAEFVGDSFGAVRYFLLAGNCEFAADMYFPEAE
jgi:hypothetical protein